MKIEKGEILQGKVTGIAKFGAFVEIAPGKSGLVYISEIANTFVKEVSDHLTVGQEVTVYQSAPVEEVAGESQDTGFEDKLKKFMKDSESRLSDIKRQRDAKGGGKRRR